MRMRKASINHALPFLFFVVVSIIIFSVLIMWNNNVNSRINEFAKNDLVLNLDNEHLIYLLNMPTSSKRTVSDEIISAYITGDFSQVSTIVSNALKTPSTTKEPRIVVKASQNEIATLPHEVGTFEGVIARRGPIAYLPVPGESNTILTVELIEVDLAPTIFDIDLD